jgi:Ca2+:H+ antiporter
MGFIAHFLNSKDLDLTLFSFVANLASLIPLSDLLAFSIDEIKGTHPSNAATIIKAIFSNSGSLVVFFLLVQTDQIRIAQMTLLGLIAYNLLFALSTALLIARKEDKDENQLPAKIQSTILFIFFVVLVSPSAIELQSPEQILTISRAIAFILFAMFVLYVAFTRCIHRLSIRRRDAEGDERDQSLSVPVASLLYVVTLLLITFHADYVVRAIPGVIDQTPLNERFIGYILLPLGMNSMVILSAVTSAYNSRVSEAVDICVNKSVETVLFLAPLVVLGGWALDESVSLVLSRTEAIITLVVVLMVATVIVSGGYNSSLSRLLSGTLFMLSYVVAGVLVWVGINQ